MKDFSYNGFVITIERQILGNRMDGKRSYSFFRGYNPTTKQFIKGQGGKIKAKIVVDAINN
jgi:hypothetical protein